MSRRANSPTLDLKLNLSSPSSNPRVESPKGSSDSSSEMSTEGSCVSSEPGGMAAVNYSGSTDTTPMILVGCPQCLLYVMLSEVDPKCPKCKSTVLLDFLRDENAKKTTN